MEEAAGCGCVLWDLYEQIVPLNLCELNSSKFIGGLNRNLSFFFYYYFNSLWRLLGASQFELKY